MTSLRFIVYSDYLCPWCYNASVRLCSLETEFRGTVELEWRSYLLRPEPRSYPDPDAALERFRNYTQGWMRIGEEPDSGSFQVWASDQGPPVSSLPAHGVSKAARAVSREAFDAMHHRLLRAYFAESQDISQWDVLRSLWDELSLPASEFDVATHPETLDRTMAEYREAHELGATGVPAVRLEGNPAVIVGAHPVSLYRRWIERSLSRSEHDEISQV